MKDQQTKKSSSDGGARTFRDLVVWQKSADLTALSLVILSSLFSILYSVPVHAATLSVRGTETIAPQGEGIVEVLLDTEGVEVNAVEGTLRLSGDFVRIQDIENGVSPLSLWLISPEFNERELRFSGVVPGGISGERIVLVRVIVEGERIGTSTLSFVDARVLHNDGIGTPIELSTVAHTITVSSDVPRTVYDSGDVIPPGTFAVTLAQAAALGGKWVAVFAAHDKETGIAYYEAQESLFENVDEAAWRRVVSPYELSDQKRLRYVFIKAVDRNGNSTLTTVSPGPNRVLLMLGLGLLVCLCVVLVYMFVRRSTRATKRGALPTPSNM